VPSFIHLGISASYVSSDNEQVQYKSRPESFLAPKLVNTGDLDAHNAFPLGLELAAERGPFSVQGEFLGSAVNAPQLGNPLFAGGYGAVSYLLTGESRPYDRRRGVFGHLDPATPVSLSHWTAGAWEVAARCSYLDLSEGAVDGGRMAVVMS